MQYKARVCCTPSLYVSCRGAVKLPCAGSLGPTSAEPHRFHVNQKLTNPSPWQLHRWKFSQSTGRTVTPSLRSRSRPRWPAPPRQTLRVRTAQASSPASWARKSSTHKGPFKPSAITPRPDRPDRCSWDDVYARELANHADDADDEGTIWFDESGAEEAVLRLLGELADDGAVARGGEAASRFLDLGTGNGHMLFALREADEAAEAWRGDMVGVDYSQASVDLARRIGRRRGVDSSVRFERWDLLQHPPGDWLGAGFDVVLDKGTFDAISLMPQSRDAPHSCEVYRAKVAGLLKPGGLLIVTSCNWTKAELLSWLSGERESGLQYCREAHYPTFTFGGQTGQSIVTIAFRRME